MNKKQMVAEKLPIARSAGVAVSGESLKIGYCAAEEYAGICH